MVPISPEIYSSTAVVMDNRSLSDYISKLEDRRLKRAAAEQEAFDDWNKANEKQLDPSNMRWAKEGPQFTKGLEEYRALSLEAKKNPKDYTKRMAAQKKADDLLALVRASREAKEIDKEWDGLIKTAIGNPEYDYEAILQRKSIHDLPIGFRAGGFMGIPVMERPANTAPEIDLYKPKPSNIVEDFDKNISGIEFGARISPTDKDYNYLIGYTPESTKAIAERVYDYVNQNSRKRSSYKVEAQSLSPTKLAEYTAILKSAGIDKKADEDDPAALAMAKAIQEAKRRGKTVPDWEARKKMESNLITSRGGSGKESGESFIDYWAEINAKPEMIIGNPADSKRQVRGVPLNSLTATPQKRIIDIANSITGEKFEQRDLILQTMPDGSKHILQVLYEGKGKDAIYPTGVKDIVAVNPEDINLKPQIDVKSKRKAVEEAKKSKGTYNIGGKSFTRQQIEQGAKAYGMTVDEYLASFENE